MLGWGGFTRTELKAFQTLSELDFIHLSVGLVNARRERALYRATTSRATTGSEGPTT